MSGKTSTATLAAEAFARDAADHELTVLHDDGLYRHLRFVRMVTEKDGSRKPTSFYWFDLITWPGCLAINGDMEGYTFSRVTDMFEFFRGHEPNPQYWAEKLRASSSVKAYSEDVFRQHVLDYYRDRVESGDVLKGLGRAIREQVLEAHEIGWEDGARGVLGDFQFGPETVTARCPCGWSKKGVTPGTEASWESTHLMTAPERPGGHRVTWRQVDGWRFDGIWEWDLSDWTHQFLWCCSAIPWAIGKYDAAKAAPELAAVARG